MSNIQTLFQDKLEEMFGSCLLNALSSSSPDEVVSVGAAGPAGSVLSQSAGHCEEELTV